MKLSAAITLFLDSRRGVVSGETLTWYHARLRQLAAFLGDIELESVTIHDLRRYRAHLVNRSERWAGHPGKPTQPGGLSVHTVHGHLRAVRAFFRWCHREGLVQCNPAERLEMPPLPDEPPRALSQDEMRRIIRQAGRNPRDHALVLFLADTGCRVSGLCGLRLQDLDLERQRATVREKGRGGRRKARTVFFTEATARALKVWLEERQRMKPQTEHVFVGLRGPGRGKPLSRSGVYQVLKRLARAAGVTRFNPHAFRHTFARDLLQNGADLGTVSQLMGHSGVQVTAQFYARWSDEELAARHALFSRGRF